MESFFETTEQTEEGLVEEAKDLDFTPSAQGDFLLRTGLDAVRAQLIRTLATEKGAYLGLDPEFGCEAFWELDAQSAGQEAVRALKENPYVREATVEELETRSDRVYMKLRVTLTDGRTLRLQEGI